MYHEWISVSAKLATMNGSLYHQAGDGGDITREAIDLGHNYAALRGLGCGQGSCQLRPAIQGIKPLAGLRLYELGNDCERPGLSETLDSRTFPVNTRPSYVRSAPLSKPRKLS